MEGTATHGLSKDLLLLVLDRDGRSSNLLNLLRKFTGSIVGCDDAQGFLMCQETPFAVNQTGLLLLLHFHLILITRQYHNLIVKLCTLLRLLKVSLSRESCSDDFILASEGRTRNVHLRIGTCRIGALLHRRDVQQTLQMACAVI